MLSAQQSAVVTSAGDPDALAWRARVRVNGGTVSGQTFRAVNRMVKAFKHGGLWSKKQFVMPICGDNLAAARTPLVVGAGLSVVTVTNIVAGDYVESGATGGLKGNGTDKYFDTGLNLSTSGASSSSLSLGAYWKGTEAGGASRVLIGNVGAGVNATFLGWVVAGANEAGSIAGSSENSPTPVITISQEGYCAVGTNGSRSQLFYKSGLLVGSGVTASAAFFNGTLFAMATNANGSPASYTTRYLRFIDIASGMTAAEQLNNYNIIHAFQQELSRAV